MADSVSVPFMIPVRKATYSLFAPRMPADLKAGLRSSPGDSRTLRASDALPDAHLSTSRNVTVSPTQPEMSLLPGLDAAHASATFWPCSIWIFSWGQTRDGHD